MNHKSSISEQHILITGGTGFLGNELVNRLSNMGYSLIVLSRQKPATKPNINYVRSLNKIASDTPIFACINLAGEPLFNGVWTQSKRNKIVQSRIETTKQIVALNNRLQRPIEVLLSGSAIGIYGDHQNTIVDEQSTLGRHFGAQLCQDWEAEAHKVMSQNTRVCLLRTGIVLGRDGGALPAMNRIFKLGLGSAMGTGHQYWPWISLNDWCRAVLFCLQNNQIKGAINLCAPTPVTNKVFSQTLSQVLNRPFWLPPIPGPVLKLLTMGGSVLLTDSVNLIPSRLIESGFIFEQTELYPCLKTVLHG